MSSKWSPYGHQDDTAASIRPRASARGRCYRPPRRLPSADAMARSSTIHICCSCGHQEARWHGQCPGCGEWNTLVEEAAPRPRARGASARRGASTRGRARGARRRSRRAPAPPPDGDRRARPRARRRPRARLARPARRLARDRQVDAREHGARAACEAAGSATLYVSGEESAAQIRLRAERLGAGRAARAGPGRDRPRDRPRHDRARSARGLRHRLGPDAARARADRRARARSARCARSPRRSCAWPRRAASPSCSSAT